MSCLHDICLPLCLGKWVAFTMTVLMLDEVLLSSLEYISTAACQLSEGCVSLGECTDASTPTVLFSALSSPLIFTSAKICFSPLKNVTTVSITVSQSRVRSFRVKACKEIEQRLRYVLPYFTSYSLQSDIFYNSRVCMYYSSSYT